MKLSCECIMVVTVSTMNETIVTVVSLSDLISSFECDELPQYQFFCFFFFPVSRNGIVPKLKLPSLFLRFAVMLKFCEITCIECLGIIC